MFAALAHSTYRRRWWTLGASGLVLIGVIAVLERGGTLTTGAIEGTESEYTQRLVEGLAGLSGDSVIAAVVGSDEWKFNELPFRQALGATVKLLKRDPDVLS